MRPVVPSGFEWRIRLAPGRPLVNRARYCGFGHSASIPRTIRRTAPRECPRSRASKWRSFEAVEFATLNWVDWFNNRRLLEPIGNIPPAEAGDRYYAMLAEQKLAA